MPAQGRVTDVGIGTCICHPIPIPMAGVIITGSLNCYSNSLPAARITDIVLAACGHIGVLITGSSTCKINGLSSSRITDIFIGCFNGVIITGSPNHFVGG